MATESPATELPALLEEWRRGDSQAVQTLFPLLGRELRLAAKRQMAGQPAGHTLQTTALVHEAYLRMAQAASPGWIDRSHFIAACSLVMRRILVDHARARRAGKRNKGAEVSLEEAWVAAVEPDTDVVALDEALEDLARVDPRKAKVVELRFFCGMSVQETAAALELSEESIFRDWRLARAFLARHLKGA